MLLGITCYGCGPGNRDKEQPDVLSDVGTREETSQTGKEEMQEPETGKTELTGEQESLPKDTQEGVQEDTQESLPQEQMTWEEYPWQMIPGSRTMENLLVTALSPVGQTMYIWGGGWNEEDTGAGSDATTLGLSPKWAEFAAQQPADYDYRDYKYWIHNGLDCSGYIGWLIYNLFETENGQEGYVMKAALMAENFAERGWGSFTPAQQVKDWKAGDIMSMKGHVWLCLGTCQDGSVLILHSSLTGVIVCGTTLPNGEKSEAVSLAEDFMSTCYPDWYERYPNCSRAYNYLTDSGQFRWSKEVLSDEWNLSAYSGEEMMDSLKKKLLAN